MDSSALSYARIVCSQTRAANAEGKTVKKNLSLFFPLNPLKSLDSDEIVRDLRDIKGLLGR